MIILVLPLICFKMSIGGLFVVAKAIVMNLLHIFDKYEFVGVLLFQKIKVIGQCNVCHLFDNKHLFILFEAICNSYDKSML